MPKSFRIKQLVDLGRWVPEDPELRDLTYFMDDGQTPRGAIRELLWQNIESLRPGEYILDQTIEDARQEVFQRIDQRTSQIIDKGFEYQGIIFSNSQYAQSRYNFMYTTALAQAQTGDPTLGFSYPLPINSMDDTAMIVLNNPIETLQFCGAAANHVKAQVEAGTTLKEQVRQATTQEDLDAFIDNRGVESLPPANDNATPPPDNDNGTPPEEPPVEEPPPEEEPPSDGGDAGGEEETPDPEGGNQGP